MVNAVRKRNGKYTIKGKSYLCLKGSRAQVFNGTCYATGYGKSGLKKGDLVKNKWGRIVSRRKHVRGKKSGLKRLHAKGYFTRKGKFGVFKKKGSTKKRRKTGKRCRHKSGPKKGKYKKCNGRRTKKRRR